MECGRVGHSLNSKPYWEGPQSESENVSSIHAFILVTRLDRIPSFRDTTFKFITTVFAQ